jgi:hypothetical protein
MQVYGRFLWFSCNLFKWYFNAHRLTYAANLTTSAFGVSNNSFNIWTLKQKNGDSFENYQSSEMTTLIPQLALLIIGIVCKECFLRKKIAVNSHEQ